MPPYLKYDVSLPPAELPRETLSAGEVRIKSNPREPRRTLANHLFLSSRNVPWLRFFESDDEDHDQAWTADSGKISPQFIQDQIRLLNLELTQRTPRRVIAVLWDSDAHFMPSIEFQYRAVQNYVDANADILLWDGEVDSVVQMVEYFDGGISPRSMEFNDFVLHFCNDHSHIVYPTIAFCDRRSEYLQLPLVAACKGKTAAILDHSIDTLRFPEQLAMSAAWIDGARTRIEDRLIRFTEKIRKTNPRAEGEEEAIYGLQTEEQVVKQEGGVKATEDQRNLAKNIWRMARQTYQPRTYDSWTVKTMKKTAELMSFDPYNNSPPRRQVVLQIAYDILFKIGLYETSYAGRIVRAILADIADNGKRLTPPFAEKKKYVGVYRHVTMQSRQDKRLQKLARLRLQEKLKRRHRARAKNYDPIAKAKYRKDRYAERIKIADRVKRIYRNLEVGENGEAHGIQPQGNIGINNSLADTGVGDGSASGEEQHSAGP